MPAAVAAANNENGKLIFKICAPFTKCISGTYNAKVDDAKGIDLVILAII